MFKARVDLDGDLVQMGHRQAQHLAHVGSHAVALDEQENFVHGDRHLGGQPVPHPARPQANDAFDALDLAGMMLHAADHAGIHGIHEAIPDRPRASHVMPMTATAITMPTMGSRTGHPIHVPNTAMSTASDVIPSVCAC